MSLQVEPDANGKTLSAPRCAVAHAWLSIEDHALLQRAADRRRIHVDQLVAEIIQRTLAAARTGEPLSQASAISA